MPHHGPEGTPCDEFALLRHDLRNPIAVVSGHAQLLRRDAARLVGLTDGDRDRLRARADAIEASAKALAALVEERLGGR